jgi:CDP-diacylglycerol--serine O-phosphatidyltransferase
MVIDLPRVLFAVGLVYALSGPCYWVWQRTRRPVEPNA